MSMTSRLPYKRSTDTQCQSPTTLTETIPVLLLKHVLEKYLSSREVRYFSHCSSELRSIVIQFKLLSFRLNIESATKYYTQCVTGCRRLRNSLCTDIENRGYIDSMNLYLLNPLTPDPVFDLSLLPQVKHLTVEEAYHITSIRGDQNQISSLTLYNCRNLIDIIGLNGIAEVSIYNSSSLTNISPLSKSKKVVIYTNHAIIDIQALHGVDSVSFMYCSSVSDVSPLSSSKCVRLSNCHAIRNIQALNNVPNLHVSGCKYLKDIQRGDNMCK